MEIHLQVHLKCQSSIEVLFSMLFTWDFLHLIIYTLLEFSSFWFSNFGSKLKEKTLLKWEENNVENLMNKLDFPINANFYETTNESFSVNYSWCLFVNYSCFVCMSYNYFQLTHLKCAVTLTWVIIWARQFVMRVVLQKKSSYFCKML